MKFRIKDISKNKGISGVELSAKVGITQQNMSGIINGKLTPSIKTLQKIATALNVPISELFDEQPHKKDNEIKCPNCGATLKIDKVD